MIRFIPHIDIDQVRWDDCIKQSPDARLYALSNYLNIAAPKWSALVMNDYEAVMPLPLSRFLGFSSCYVPYLCQQLGVFATSKLSEKLIEEFKGKLNQYSSVRFRMHSGFRDKLSGYKRHNRQNTLLCLSPNSSDLRTNYKSNCKRNIKKANSERPINQLLGNDIPCKEFLQLFRSNRGKQLSFGNEYYRRMESLLTHFQTTNQAIFFSVNESQNEDQQVDKLSAGVFLVRFKDRIYNLLQAQSAWGRENGQLFRLFDAVIEAHSEQEFTLDFEGSMDEGVARFYLGFGGYRENYTEFRSQPANKLVARLKSLRLIQ